MVCCGITLMQILMYFYYRNEYLRTINVETVIDIGNENKKDFSSIENMKERPVKIETNSY